MGAWLAFARGSETAIFWLIRFIADKRPPMPEMQEILPVDDPYELFALWLAEAEAKEPADPNAMMLATVGADGFPTARAMLMKGYDADGFVFYTNQQSRKSDQIRANQKVGLCFYWKSLYRQVHVEGHSAPVSAAESDAYFASRPRQSQIGAWASVQSRPLESRAFLEKRLEELTAAYEGKPVPRPPHWGGYRVSPVRIEFWSGHPFRLHDRVVYRATDKGWTTERLYP